MNFRALLPQTPSLTEAYEKSRPQLLDIVQDLGSYSGDHVGVGADEQEGRAQIKRRLDIHLDSAGLGTLSE